MRLPELLDLVLSFVAADPKFNASLLRTCHAWHASLEPHLYASVNLVKSHKRRRHFLDGLEARRTSSLRAVKITILRLVVASADRQDLVLPRLQAVLKRSRTFAGRSAS